jgi:[ribosomal protein S18]-alanine N-acetyltransferase
VTIRAATSQDSQALAAIHAACFDTAWTEEALRTFIDAGGVTIWGAVPVGFLIVSQIGDEAEIITLAIAPSARRGGIARALIAAKMEALSKSGVTRLFLEVAADNDAARGLYADLCFTQVGLRKNYYARNSEAAMDALVLARALDT